MYNYINMYTIQDYSIVDLQRQVMSPGSSPGHYLEIMTLHVHISLGRSLSTSQCVFKLTCF